MKEAKTDKANPYEKIFDDAHRMLKQTGNQDFVEKLDAYKEDESGHDQQIPFPYGGRRNSTYNFR